MSEQTQASDPEIADHQESVQLKGESIVAGEVHATGTINQVNAKEVHFKDGGVFVVQAGSMDLHDGGAFLVSTQNSSVVDSGLAVLLSDQVDMAQSNSQVIFARDVHADQIKSKLLIARSVQGNVETLLDGPKAIMAGLAYGLGLGLAVSLVNLLIKKFRL